MDNRLPASLRGRVIFGKGMRMSDLIDREALLRQIDIDSEGEPGYYGDTWKFIDTIKSMPPAEHGTNLAEVGTDCISRQSAIDAFNTNIDELVVAGKENADSVERYLNRVIDEIKQLPPIQPEIIRCKDCGHYRHGLCMKASMCVNKSENGFCDWAKRRDDG